MLMLSLAYFWVTVLTLLTLITSLLSVWLFKTSVVLNISMSLFYSSYEPINVMIVLNSQTTLFTTVVLLISTVVFVFNTYYFSSLSKLTYFNWMTFLFVVSMVILINFNDFFFILLGWDGLGVTSYFLVAYYQSSTSIYSSSLTILMNRVGDSLFILFVVFLWLDSSSLHFVYLSPFWAKMDMALLLFFTLSTKSALFPFSPWLPAAMAAPTPISSLVHSSTLVTAGLFLMINNSNLLCLSDTVSSLMIIVSLFTSLYAGLASLFEPDLKKVVALSTLSHLGFICLAISLSLTQLAFFHLLSHALFKSSLFISIGSFMINNNHYQDSRLFSSLYLSNPFLTSIIIVSEANLFALPALSGFYSKDLLLEMTYSFSSFSSFFLFTLYFNIILTFSYTLRIFLSLVMSKTSYTYIIQGAHQSPAKIIFFFALSLLSFFSIFSGLIYSSLFLSLVISVPFMIKVLPFIILFLMFIMFFFMKSYYSIFNFTTTLTYPLVTLLNLSPLWSNTFSKTYLQLNSYLYMHLENSFLKNLVYKLFYFISLFLSKSVHYTYTLSLKTSSSLVFIMLLLFILYNLIY